MCVHFLVLNFYLISFVSNVLYSILAFKQCRKAEGLGNRTLVLSLGMRISPVTPITKLDLGLFLPDCVLVYLSPLYTHFIITIIYYYQLYVVEFTPWKRQNGLCNHFVEGGIPLALNLP